MKKMDATELVKALEEKLDGLRNSVSQHEFLLNKAKEEMWLYEHLLSLVKYEEEEDDSVAVSYCPRTSLEDRNIWENMAIDTLIEVRNTESSEWTQRYFSQLWYEGRPYYSDFQVCANTSPSKKHSGAHSKWKYFRLIEKGEEVVSKTKPEYTNEDGSVDFKVLPIDIKVCVKDYERGWNEMYFCEI